MGMNLMIVGVGGQGTLLTSKILGKVATKNNLDVKVSEIHGLSQRGGSVVTYVRFDKEKVYSPIIDIGESDYILSFELLETLRWLPYLKKDGMIITNTQQINPMSVIMGIEEYPTDIINKIKKLNVKIKDIDALSLANQIGNSKVVNVILLGYLSKYFDFEYDMWIETIKEVVSEKFYDVNYKAFNVGRNLEI